jgi:SAM-dependent methyltransferase
MEPYLWNCRDSGTGDKFEVRRCAICKLGMTWPRPDNLSRYYSGYYGGRHGTTAEHCANRRVGFVRNVCGDGNNRLLLDVGCGDGSFLLTARRQGWRVLGTEMNPKPARDRGLEVLDDIEQCQSAGPFDCITLWHSLEHLDDPIQTLYHAHRLLKPGGFLVFAVPDIEGLQAGIFGRHWFHLDVPRHLYHFGPESVKRILQLTGFVPVLRLHQEFEYDLMGWSQSALNALHLPQNLFFHMVLKRATGAGIVVKFFTYLLGACFCALALPLVPAGALLSRGGTLIVGAKAKALQ